ncbi:ANTAR domain-containing protein [Streptomyces chartreusis]
MTDNKDLLDKIAALQREVDQLRHALVSHAVVDQAIGVLRAVHGLDGQESWDVLQRVSQNTNVKLREVAEDVLRWAASGRPPDTIDPALREAVTAVGPRFTLIPGDGAATR